jgi:DNA repair protein RadD
VLLVLPTAGGKTSLFASLASQLCAHGKRAVVVVHRRELATQAANRFREFGTDFGFIMAGEPAKPTARLQIASVQTLVRRTPPPADLVICDEAHLSTAHTWQTVLAAYPNARILGVTATPWRLSGKPLVGAYDACVVVATPRELREQGWLCNYVGFSYLTPDLSQVATTGGDFNERQSSEAMSSSVIVDNVVEEWLKHASTLSTVVFNVTVEHSLAVTAKFKAAGVSCEHLDGTTPKLQRAAILKRVDEGRTLVLCNVGVCVEGLDIPRIKCVVLNRPTKSLARYMQQVGRGRRPWNGQTLRIHDHAFNIRRFGLPDDDRDYTLNAKPEKPPSLTQCDECMALYSGRACPACAHENETDPAGERVLATVADAEQFEFSSEDTTPAAPRKAVRVRWDNPRTVTGKFVRSWGEQTSFGQQTIYLLSGKRFDYELPGTTHLNALMKNAQIPDSELWVTYLGPTEIGRGRSKKMFKVEVDDGT